MKSKTILKIIIPILTILSIVVSYIIFTHTSTLHEKSPKLFFEDSSNASPMPSYEAAPKSYQKYYQLAPKLFPEEFDTEYSKQLRNLVYNNYVNDLLYDNLVKGLLAYNIPDTMKIFENYKATVTITKAKNDSILFVGIWDREKYHKEVISISSRVKVKLIDPTNSKIFQISSYNSEEQLVDDNSNTVWNWNVKPLIDGVNNLTVIVTVKILDRLGENYKDIVVYEKTVKVNTTFVITISQFVLSYWQWFTTVFFIPLLYWLIKKVNLLKEKRKHKTPIGFT